MEVRWSSRQARRNVKIRLPLRLRMQIEIHEAIESEADALSPPLLQLMHEPSTAA